MKIFIFSIGRAKRDGLNTERKNPGPGAYEFKSGLSGPKYHFCGRYPLRNRSFTPGPSHYSPDYKKRVTRTTYGYSMGGKYSFSSRSKSPGPGSYEIKVNKKKTMGKFGTDNRRALSHSCSGIVPGPGTYTAEAQKISSNHREAPKYTY